MTDNILEIDKTYSESQVESVGLIPRKTNHITSRVFVKSNKVYFFEDLKNSKLRLFSIINEKSFFL
jgi:hypothetical protein